jgi:SAM-dependent methyltransferase
MLEYESIALRIAGDGAATVLDWGSGWGQVSQLLVRAGLEVESFDYGGPDAPDELTQMPRYPALSVYLGSDPVRLPYGDESFDAVLSCGVLEHVQDPDASLEELKRVLHPRGTLYIYKLPNRWSYLERVARRLGLYYHGQDRFDRLYTLDSAESLLARHGYEVVELRHANMLPLSLTGRAADLAAPAVFTTSRLLAHVPVARRVATNIELVALAPPAGKETRSHLEAA